MISVIITLIVVGVLLWLANTYIPMDGRIKTILNWVTIALVIVYLLGVFGILGYIDNSIPTHPYYNSNGRRRKFQKLYSVSSNLTMTTNLSVCDGMGYITV
jgi:amino acid transporter